ncbi:glycosyltransferase family 2 protein [Parahaliea maris]|uniref:Glycosyltransferase family 2 protein n=2 Tax=Parahaliea maris TaxID=2716870 RepID=A0A5C8ZV10_9GAMM|nr:glycosyltransferase family 2 protein [Parahaliea maris]
MINEEDMIQLFFATVTPLISECSQSFEIIVVNDGSTDQTLARLILMREQIPQLRIVDLSRNFGKEAALTAGLAHARGEAVIMIDADLQDPPELIPEMVAHWREGFDVVTHVRTDRYADGFFKRATANAFYRLINKISDTEITPNAGDYRLLARPALDAFLSLEERIRFNKGLFEWLGFREMRLAHARSDRAIGTTKWNYRKLFRFAVDGITSFSSFPLKVWSWLGFSLATGAFIYGAVIVIKTVILGVDQPGYASLMTVMLFFNGITLVGIGMLGEYVSRIFVETKRRPLYLVRKVYE